MSQSDILAAPVLDMHPEPDSKWKCERQAFLCMLPELLGTYRNQYVAIHEGRVVGSGPDLVEVAVHAYGQFGYVPIYVDLVAERPLPPVRLPSPLAISLEESETR